MVSPGVELFVGRGIPGGGRIDGPSGIVDGALGIVDESTKGG